MNRDLPSVLITGSAKRVGAAIAQGFAKAGWHVVIHYGGSIEEAEALAASLPSAEAIQCDLSDSEAAAAMIGELAEVLCDWRVLINNASVFPYDGADCMDEALFDQSMQINAKAPAMMTQTFFHSARSAHGRRAIHITDQKLQNPNPDFFSYTMSKHALNATVDMLAMAQGPKDRVYAIAPGAILPSHDQSADEIEISHRLNPLKRKTDASEIADAALFLADGDLASGQTLSIDSGQHLLGQPRDVIYLAREQAAKAAEASQ